MLAQPILLPKVPPPHLTRRTLDDHHALYLRYLRELEDIGKKRRLVTWAKPPDSAPAFPSEVEALLDKNVQDLDLTPAGVLKEVLDELKGELNARGITWFPTFVPGEDEFYTLDRATTRLVRDEPQQAVIAYMQTMRNREASLETIARKLNADGVTGAMGGKWTATSVARVLRASPPQLAAVG